MTLHKKHLEAVEVKNFWESKVDSMIEKIKADQSGSCWHIDEVAQYTKTRALELDKQSTEERLKQPLWGLSAGVKDLFAVKGLRTTAGSQILSNFIAPYTSTVWKDLESRGALLGAKLSMDEFAMGSFTNTSYLGRTSVPGHPEHTAGGSSGGSGAALAADLVDFTIGSDTGGSVRLPAAFCGVFGYKPSYGAFSRYGMISYASSLDQAGFLTQKFEDLQYLLDTGISHQCENDFTSIGIPRVIKNNVALPLKVGYFPEVFESDGVSEEVKREYQAVLNVAGKSMSYVEFVPVNIPLMKEAASIYYIIACSEAASNLARYQGIYTGPKLVEENFNGSYWEQCAQYRSKFFGEEVQKRLMLGAYITSSENFGTLFEKARQLRQLLTQQLNAVLETVNMLVLPTAPTTAPKWTDIEKMTSAQIYMSDYMTVPFSLAGLPVVSVPLIRSENSLSVGIQFVGKKMGDYQLLQDMKWF